MKARPGAAPRPSPLYRTLECSENLPGEGGFACRLCLELAGLQHVGQVLHQLHAEGFAGISGRGDDDLVDQRSSHLQRLAIVGTGEGLPQLACE